MSNNANQSDSLSSLLTGMHQERVQLALKIHDMLRDWCGQFTCEGPKPNPVLTIAGYYVGLAIGDFHVWDSECGFGDRGDGELTFERFVAVYQKEIRDLCRWPRRQTRAH